MKFTKEDANKELVAKLTANGETLSMSQRTVNEMIENLYSVIASEEMELDDFVSKSLLFFKTANSNIRNDVSVGIKEYKEKNPVKTEEPVVEQPKTTEDNNELLKRLEAMEKKIQENELENKKKAVKSEIVSKLNEKGLKDNEWIESLLLEIPIGEDFDVESKVDSYLKLYNKSKASVNPDITPDNVGGGGSGDEALAERMKKVAQYAKSQNLID